MFKKKLTDRLTNGIKRVKETFSQSERTKKDQLIFAFNVTFEVFRSLVYFFVIAGILGGALLGGIGIGYFAYLVADTNVPDKNELQDKINDVEQISTLTYANGDKIADIKSDLIRTNITSDTISPLVKKALISTEDEYFNTHNGVVPKAVIRALVSEATNIGTSGGSTITQQLVKQQILTSETSYKRKANEIVLALRVENFFTKDEIITSYLNVSPFGRNNKGQNIAGVQEAAKGIFNTTAKDLTLPQAAYLAGLPQSPITYSPYTNTGTIKKDLTEGLARKDHVLYNMYKEAYITQAEYEAAKTYDLTKDFSPTESASDEANGYLYYFAHQQTIEVLMPIYYEKDGLTKKDITDSDTLYSKYKEIAERELRRDGYTIQTTIDKNVYNGMKAAEQNYAYVLDDGRSKTMENGMVILDNKTGRIISFIGGRDYNQNQNNHAFQTRRSPGSTIKPLIAYAPAIDQGLIGSESMLSDHPKKFASGEAIYNYGFNPGSNKFETAREALKKSDNIPVTNLYEEVLAKANPQDYFTKMNMPMTEAEFHYGSISLGGTDYGPTVLEQTNAFATLANKGVYQQGYAIQKITDNFGKVIYEHKEDPVQVFSPATASIMNHMMRDVINAGTGTYAKSFLASTIGSGAGYADWVGKTGTSQEFKDFWFIASTPAVTVSSWIGYDDNTFLYENWDNKNKEMWAYLTNAAYQANPELFGISQRFELDSSVIQATVSDFTGQLKGTANVNGQQRYVPGREITSLWAQSGPSNSTFRFGFGGSDAQYQAAWDATIPKPKPKPKMKTEKKEVEKKEVKKETDDDDD